MTKSRFFLKEEEVLMERFINYKVDKIIKSIIKSMRVCMRTKI